MANVPTNASHEKRDVSITLEVPGKLEQRFAKIELEQIKLESKLEKLNPDRGSGERVSPVTGSILVALVAALAAILGNIWQGHVNSDLEQKKFESSLIQKAVERGDKAEQLTTLQFFVNAGLIADNEQKIRSLEPSGLPKLTNASASEPAPSIAGGWAIALESDISLSDAEDNVWKMGKRNGFDNTFVFKRPEGFRTCVIFRSEEDAKQQIGKARTINPTVSEPKNLGEWCTQAKWNETQQFFECGNQS